MRLELKDINDCGLKQDYSCKVEDFPVLVETQKQENLRFTDVLTFNLRLQKTGQIVEVDGSFVTRVAMVCSHCLQDFEQELCGDFALTYTPRKNGSEPVETDEVEEVELDTDELGLVYYKDETLDLFQSLQEQVVMALPIAPVCQEDCRGLCPECGCILSNETCNCEKKLFNNKFSALAGLKLESSD